MNVSNKREKLIIENELKFMINQKSSFVNIFNYLNDNYDVIPYKNANMYDFYYDTPDQRLLNRGILYRIRYRPQISINIKLPQRKTGYIWSRFEYSCKFDNKKVSLYDLFNLDCEINDIMQNNLQIDMNQLTNTAIINSFRIGFNVRFRSKNVLGDNELVGVAFFDRSENLLTHQTFLEFEMESYEQTDVFASPYIFNEFEMIGEYISSLGNQSSTLSKYERCIANLTN